jgi:GT2 family glycosyltransferase
LPDPLVTVAIPTLHAGAPLQECLASLERQSFRDFQAVVVDNSGQHLAEPACAPYSGVACVENARNAGFGAAINQVWRASNSPLIAALNDDAVAHPDWLDALVRAIDTRPEVAMCASQVRLAGTGALDSAGMLIAADASSKQRGHGQPPERYGSVEEVLLPSGSAALYRRKMLEQTGGFDEDFFLFCEDTDLGLRAHWAGWRCLYVPDAVVDHRYSQTAGAASALKAYYVERNRLFVLLKNYPVRMLLRAPAATLARYGWHVVGAVQGRGASGQFREHSGVFQMAYIVLRAHAALLAYAPRLWRERRAVRRRATIAAAEFEKLLASFAISPREVAAQ